MFAARKGHTDIVKYLFENTKQRVNDRDIVSHLTFELNLISLFLYHDFLLLAIVKHRP